MRLLNAKTRRLEEIPAHKKVRYAILSHTWGEEEITFQGIDHPETQSKNGYAKIRLCCEQALKDGLDFAWVDTCCIDKSSSVELSEAINSMYAWYRDAEVCYAFLSDVDYDTSITPSTTILREPTSRWFTRGWTLQELIAPSNLKFYAKDWSYLGDKRDLLDAISIVTCIDREFFFNASLSAASVAERMSWVSRRQTTRAEDIAYCLLGIFDANMPHLYGEGGQKAFIRLQLEIMKTSDDQSIFAWGGLDYRDRSWEDLGISFLEIIGSWMEESENTTPSRAHFSTGLLAESPKQFHDTGIVEPISESASQRLTTRGPFIEMRPLVSGDYAFLSCRLKGSRNYTVAIPLTHGGGVWYRQRHTGILAVPTLYMYIAWIARLYRMRTFSLASSPTYEWPYPWYIRSLTPGIYIADIIPDNCWSRSRRTLSNTYDNHSSDDGTTFRSGNEVILLRKIRLVSNDRKREYTLVLLVSVVNGEHQLRYNYGIEKGGDIRLAKPENTHNFQTSVPARTITIDESTTIAVLARPRKIRDKRMLVVDIIEGPSYSLRSLLFWRYYLCEAENLDRRWLKFVAVRFLFIFLSLLQVRNTQRIMAHTGSYFDSGSDPNKIIFQKTVLAVIRIWKVYYRVEEEDEDYAAFLFLASQSLRLWVTIALARRLIRWFIIPLVQFLRTDPDIFRMDY